MIEEGQKLKHGDFFENGTIEQYRKLLMIEDNTDLVFIEDNSRHCFTYNNIVASGKEVYLIWSEGPDDINDPKVEGYTFMDFHRMCINTFGDLFSKGKNLKI